MALNLLSDDELELLDSKGVEALSDDALARLDSEDAAPESKAPSIPSPITAASEGLQRLNTGITEASTAIAAPVAAPIDAAIKRVDERFAMPSIKTIQKTEEGDIHGDLFPDLIAQAVGSVTGKLVDQAMGDTPELVKRGVKDVAAGGVGAYGEMIGGMGRIVGFENIGRMIQKSTQQTAKELMPPDPNIVDQIAQGLGSMGAFMIPGLGIARGASAVAVVAPRLAMFLGTATSSVLEAGTEAGSVYDRVMEKTGDPVEANVAAGRAFFANLPLIHYTNKLGWAGEQSGRAARALESFLTEGVQEGGQQFISNFAAHDPLMKGVVESAFVGGIVGGMAGAAVHTPVRSIQQPEVAPPSSENGVPPPPGATPTPPAAPLAPAPAQAPTPEAALEPAPTIPTPQEIAAIPEEVPSVQEPAPVVGESVRKAEEAVTEAEAALEKAKGKNRKTAQKDLAAANEALEKAKASEAEAAQAQSAPVSPETLAEGGPSSEAQPSPYDPSIAGQPAFIKAQAMAKEAGFDTSKPEEVVKSYQEVNGRLHAIKELVQKGETKAMSEEQVKILSDEAREVATKVLASEPLATFVTAGEVALPVYTKKFGFRQEKQSPVEFAVERLEAAGYDPKTARTLATVFEGFRVLGERAGIAAHKLFDRYGVRVVKGEGKGGTVLEQGATGPGGRDLIIQHNLSAAKLLHAVKMGGIPVPSLAITKSDHPTEGFGEITLIGKKELADPKGYAGTKVFGSDIYSPRYPRISYKIDHSRIRALAAKLDFKRVGESEYSIESEIDDKGPEHLENLAAVKAAFLDDKGIKWEAVKGESGTGRGGISDYRTRSALRDTIEKKGLTDEFQSFVRQMFNDLSPQERIFQGFTYSGNRRYKAHTLGNVVAMLKKELRGGESSGNIYGVGQLRSKITPQFRSLSAIRDAKDKLVPKADFEKVKEEINAEFFKIADALAPYYDHERGFRYSDTVMAVMEDAPRKGFAAAFKEYGFSDVSEEAQGSVGDFLTKLRDLPTEYFEAKVLRAVDLTEFKAAVVPEDTSREALTALKKLGVGIETYNRKDPLDRARVIKATADKFGEQVLFQNGQNGPRGRLRIEYRQFSIEILEGADLSTFLHESGHLYLEVLGDIAADPAASEQVKGDYQTLLDWFGAKSRADVTTAHHEQFARGFEAYLMEGKAPTKSLQTAFDAFKEWLGAIYKQLSALEVDLTPEVRRVFDRMLATDAELAVELQDAEKALERARSLKSDAEAQAPPEAPQDALPAAKAAVPEAEARVKKAKEKAKPISKQAKTKPGDGARVEGVKRSVLEAFSESLAGTAMADSEAAKKPFTFLKPTQMEKFVNAGLLDTNFIPTPLAGKAMAELARLKDLMKTGYLEDISISEPKKLTLKSILKGIIENGRFGLLKTYDAGWVTDGRIMFRTMKEDDAVYATFKHMGEKFTNPVNLDPVISSAEKATDHVIGVIGVHEVGDGKNPSYLLQTEGGRYINVAANYYNFFKERYPDAKMFAQGEGMALRVELGGQMVGALMPMKGDLKYTVYAMDGTAKPVEMAKGRLEIDAKMAEIVEARKKHDFAKKVHAENEKEIRQLDETPGEKTAALITKIAEIQKENLDLESEMAEASKSISSLEEQVAALREQHGITDIPVSGLVKKSRPKGGKRGGKGASSGDFAYDTPVELGGMEHIKPFRMPEMVRLAYELMGKVPEIGGLRTYNGYFKGRGAGEIKLNPIIFQKPEQAAKTLAHEIGHLVDYLPDHTLKRGNLLGSLKSLQSHLSNTFGTLQVTNKDLRDELMAVTDYWRPWDKEASTDSYRSYRKSARELYADAISMLFNTPGTLERMAPKFYKGFFDALDAKPAVKLAFFDLQAFLNMTEMDIQEARHLDRKAMYLKAEDLWALKRKEQEARESHYGEWFKQMVVEKHQKAIGLVEAAVSKGEMLPPSADPRYILEELSLADNANHAFLEEIDAKVVKPLTDSEVTLVDLGDYLYLSRVAQGDRQAFANPKGYNPEEATNALNHTATRLGAERFAKLEAGAAAFREVVYRLSEEAVSVGAYSQQVFDEKIKPNRGSYAVFAVQDFLEDYIAAGVKEQIGTLKDIANPFTATIMKMVALNRLISKQKGANVMRDFLMSRGEAEKAEALNPQDNLVQFRQRKGKGLLELLEDGKRSAYYVDPYIAEAFKKKEAGTFQLGVKILDSVFNGVFRPLYITFNIGFQLYSNPIRDLSRTRRNVYALVKNEGYAGTVKSLMMAYFDSLSPAAKRAMDIPDALVSEMIANKSLDITFTDFSFDPDADQYMAVMRKMGVAPPQQNGIIDKMSKTKILYPLARFLEGIRFIGNTHETASKISGYKVLKADQLKTLDAAISEEKDEARKKFLVEQRKLLEKGEGEYAHQLAYNTRNYVGTPNWRRRGTISHITNTIFPFSNIMVQGMRSDLDVATRPETRTGFMFDMVLTQVLPKLLMFMAALGGAGDDAEEFFRKVSEYDKSNYIIVPMGWSYNEKGGRKSVYWRIPHDESGRLVAAVAWKVMNAMRGDPRALQQIVDFGAGQLPNLAPPITIGATWLAYLSGKNPYDDFRGRPLMPDKVHRAGGRHALTAMVKWTVNQMGLASFATHDPSGKSSVESMLQVAPLLNRIIKISDYGEREESMNKLSEKQAEDAVLSLERGRASVSYTKERYILSQKLAAEEISTDERKRLIRLNKYYPTYLTYSKAIKRANENGDEKKVEHYREKLDLILAKVVE